MIKIAIITFLAVCIFGAVRHQKNKKQKDTFKTVNTTAFEKLLHSKRTFLLDVRTPEEFAEGHINNAALADVKAPQFIERVEQLKGLTKEKTVAVYCRSGVRSVNAAKQLAAAGYKVVNLDGGFLQWVKDEKSVEK